MHTAIFLSTDMFEVETDMFEVEIAGQPSTPQALLDWGPQDRLGIVVTEPFGGLGGSLLVQLATSVFYDEPTKDRRNQPVYPDIYCFHVGGRYGNHGAYDFAPSRKEFIVPDGNVLGWINSHGITHLLVPDGPQLGLKHGFKEPEAALDRLKQCYAYGNEGQLNDYDVVVRALGPGPLRNSQMTLPPEQMMRDLSSRTWSSPDEAEDKAGVVRGYLERADEVGEAARAAKEVRFTDAEAAGFMEEHYRRVDPTFALDRLGVDAGAMA